MLRNLKILSIKGGLLCLLLLNALLVYYSYFTVKDARQVLNWKKVELDAVYTPAQAGILDKAHERSRATEGEALFNSHLILKIWVDIPGDFPARRCLLDYNGVAATDGCILDKHHASTWIVSMWNSHFRIVNYANNRCLEPLPSPSSQDIQVQVKDCSTDSSAEWRYGGLGQLEWSGGGCVTGLGGNAGNRVVLRPCSDTLNEQRFEFGFYIEDPSNPSNNRIEPLNIKDWQDKQNFIRDRELEKSAQSVRDAQNTVYKFNGRDQRRAVVFYLEARNEFFDYLRWWLLAWKLLGLNSVKERFDLVVFAHPDAIEHLPPECQPYRTGETELSGAGKCIYVSLVGISHRDKNFDGYLNSHECLISGSSGFLTQYSHILRSDMDTFPTPGLLGSWPKTVLANKYNQVYTFRNANGTSVITEQLKAAAQSLNLQHKGWHDICSSWFGPSESVLKLSKLTVTLYRYLRSYMFGPGTYCKCATCVKLPEDCSWGLGLYEPTLLLYSQELAINNIWTEEDYKTLTGGYLDYGTTTDDSVCNPEILHMHIYHSDDIFSKFSFQGGKYNEFDMINLNLTKRRDYSMYLALKSSGKGTGEKEISAKFQISEEGSLAKICRTNNLN